MNIFVVEENPVDAARALCDKHVVKMVLESVQLLSTVAQARGHEGPYKATHAKHPCTLWTGRHPANWAWLVRHASALSAEYTDRYGKLHKCDPLIQQLEERSSTIWSDTRFSNDSFWKEHTPFEQCMPDAYKRPSAVEAYRAYYIGDKAAIARWKDEATQPIWFALGLLSS